MLGSEAPLLTVVSDATPAVHDDASALSGFAASGASPATISAKQWKNLSARALGRGVDDGAAELGRRPASRSMGDAGAALSSVRVTLAYRQPERDAAVPSSNSV